MKKLLLPVFFFGCYLLALGIGGFTAHYFLLSYPHYSPLAQAVILILSGINVILGLLFIFLRRIFFLVIQLLLFLVFRRMEKTVSSTLKNLADELNRIKVSLD
jgi:hypothetical protein